MVKTKQTNKKNYDSKRYMHLCVCSSSILSNQDIVAT